MRFDNITKGTFEASGNAVHETKNGHCIHVSHDENRYENAEFIAFCFNLQQKYDLNKLEDIICAFGLMNDAMSVFKIPLNYKGLLEQFKREA